MKPAAEGNGAIEVTVVNDLGGEIISIVSHGAETTLVDLPLDSVPRHLRNRCAPKPGSKLVTVPGALWFYCRDGTELGFLMDANAGAYTAKLAVERPREGNPFDNDEREIPE